MNSCDIGVGIEVLENALLSVVSTSELGNFIL